MKRALIFAILAASGCCSTDMCRDGGQDFEERLALLQARHEIAMHERIDRLADLLDAMMDDLQEQERRLIRLEEGGAE